MTDELAVIAVAAIHKLRIEIERGHCQPKSEFDRALEYLDEMKAQTPGWSGGK